MIGGRNDVQLRNYAAVCMAKEMEEKGKIIYQEGDRVVGCVFCEDDRYSKHYLKPDMDNLARFICSSDNDKLLCNSSDYAIASTMGIYVDVAVGSFLKEVFPYLEKYQKCGSDHNFEELD